MADSSGNAPEFYVYVVEDREGKDPFWTRIGSAWAHKDGKGYSVRYTTPNGAARLSLRVPGEPEPEPEPEAKPQKTHKK